MGGDQPNDDRTSFAFESVSIGRVDGNTVEVVSADSAPFSDSAEVEHRFRWIALGVGCAVLVAVVGWTAFGRGAIEVSASRWPELPADPTETFTWTAESADTESLFVGGSADDVIVLAATTTSGTIYALNADGSERWRSGSEHFTYGTARRRGDDVIATLERQTWGAGGSEERPTVTVVSLDAQTGRQNWKTTTPADWWFEHDDHLVAFYYGHADYPPPTDTAPPRALYSIDLESGDRSPPVPIDGISRSVADDFSVVVERDGEAMFVDGNLAPTSSPVAVGDGIVGGGHGKLLTVVDATMTLYDEHGLAQHATPVPSFLGTIASLQVSVAANDVWFYTTDDALDSTPGPVSGAFRFSDEGTPVELWQRDNVYISGSVALDAPDAGSGDASHVYGLAYSTAGEVDGAELIDLATGEVIHRGVRLSPGSNGIVAERNGRVAGYRPPLLGDGATSVFDVGVTGTFEWTLIDRAIAIITPAQPERPTVVAVYT